jgi:methyl-accepting chemotaxis protein
MNEMVKETNILKKLFLDRYNSVDFIIKTKATYTLYLTLILLVADLLPFILMFIEGFSTLEFAFRITAGAILIFNLYLIKKGNFHFAANFLIGAIIIILTGFASIRGYKHFYEMFILAFLLEFAIITTCLVGYSKVQPWVVAGLSFIIVVVFHITRTILFVNKDAISSGFESLFFIALFFALSGFLGGILMSSFNIYINMALNEMKKNQERANELGKVITSAQEGMSIGDNLLHFAKTNRERVQESEEILNILKSKFTDLSYKMKLAKNNNAEIAEFSRNVNEKTQNHAADIHESTAAIEEMNAIIDSLSKISSEKKDKMVELQTLTEVSASEIDRALESIKRVVTFSKTITEIGNVIQSISSKTNLLAMNANIEAAHAGEAGKGFAVVAKEIRNLAEITSKNASNITKTLKDISIEIEDAESINMNASNSFKVIKAEVKTVNEAMEEVFRALSEIKSGISEITKAVIGIRENSTEIETTVKDISERSTGSEKELAALESSFNENSLSITKILSFFKEISNGIIAIENIGQENLGQIAKVKEAVAELEKE